MNKLYEIIKNSNLADLFFNYFSGNFFISENENCIRRADGNTLLRATGLHKDGQLSLISEQGINSKDELTVWTPLVDCSKKMYPDCFF